MNTKEKIFEVSLDLFSKKGYDSVSLREIAEEVGIKKSSIYSHYSSKEAILMDIFDYLTNIFEYDEMLNSKDLDLNANNEILLQNPEKFYHKGSEAMKEMFSQEKNLKIWKLLFIQMHHNDAIRKFFQDEILAKPMMFWEGLFTILKENHVTAIELGAQSLNDRVLRLNNRGHNTADVVKASALIKSFGFELGLQLMTGLYADSDTSAIRTAKRVIEIAPDTVRIYPTIVLKDTDLAALYADNIYSPQTLEEAVNLAVKLYLNFTEANIKVIRLGLHSIDEKAYIAGPWHPAFSELCQSRIMLNKAFKLLKDKGKYNIYVGKSDVSKMIGQKRCNLIHLSSLGYECRVKVKENLGDLDIEIEREEA
jgi:histone acetyltransferase (RNA polymerase elongator complex component)